MFYERNESIVSSTSEPKIQEIFDQNVYDFELEKLKEENMLLQHERDSLLIHIKSLKSYHKSFKSKRKPRNIRVNLESERKYGLNHSHLVDTATIILSGQQFEKFFESMMISNRTCVSRGTYFRHLPVVERVIKKIWKEEQERLVKIVKEKKEDGSLGELLIAIDAGWHKRGHTSELGNFAGVLISCHSELNNKVIFASNKEMSRKKLVNGKDEVVFEGNHTGSSKAMEGVGFVEMQRWLGVEMEGEVNVFEKGIEKERKRGKKKIEVSEDEDFI